MRDFASGVVFDALKTAVTVHGGAYDANQVTAGSPFIALQSKQLKSMQGFLQRRNVQLSAIALISKTFENHG